MMNATDATMRILSWQDLRQAAELPEEKPTGLFSRRSPRPSGPSPEKMRMAREASTTLEVAERTYRSALDNYGNYPFDLSRIVQFLQPPAILDEAATFHRIFPEEREAWMPAQALLRCLRTDLTKTEGRILLQRLWQAQSAFLAIELAPCRGDDGSRREATYLVLFFYTGTILDSCSCGDSTKTA